MSTNKQQAAAGPNVVETSDFEATCLQLVDRVAETGEEIVITRNGRPVARLVPYRTRPRTLFGIDRGRIELVGDIVEPVNVRWESQHDTEANDGN